MDSPNKGWDKNCQKQQSRHVACRHKSRIGTYRQPHCNHRFKPAGGKGDKHMGGFELKGPSYCERGQ